MSTRFWNSITAACEGIGYTWRHERNFKIQIVGAFFIVIASLWFELKSYELITVYLLIVLVLILELVNTTIEKFLDLLKPRLHGHVKIIKDIMAGAVLIASLGALVIGAIIFIPHIMHVFELFG